MVALVDGVPRTLTLDQFVTNWIAHQIEVIQRRTRFRKRKAEERAHILLGLLKAIDRIDEVIAFIRRSKSAAEAMVGLQGLLDIDELQARAILDMQLRRLAALERQKIIDEAAELEALIVDYKAIIADPVRQKSIINEELAEIVARHGDDRRTLIQEDKKAVAEVKVVDEPVTVVVSEKGWVRARQGHGHDAGSFHHALLFQQQRACAQRSQHG